MLLERNRENRLHRQLFRQFGYRLCKSRLETPNADNMGGYSVIWEGAVVCGARFELSLDDVEQFMQKCREEGPEV